MHFDILFDTERFNLSEVKAHFINPCCFGEDLAIWLREKLLANGAAAIEPGQEDWGWHFEARLGDDAYFIGIGGAAEESPLHPNLGEWRIMIEKHRSLWEKLSGQNKTSFHDAIFNKIRGIIESESDFKNIRYE
ncbi:MAG: hypothetical protein H7Z39_08720 [Burkholderiaceae bacterium]|nr:hypothetical protein [Burkholderiaceae bacterium]